MIETELEKVRFRLLKERSGPKVQAWELLDPIGEVFAWAEIFPAEAEWWVRLYDQAAMLSEAHLLQVIKRLLVWEISCPADTVQVELKRNGARHTLVRVGAEYI
ncbi:MAG: hypothetical protein OEY14_15510 [Myxococcales bacterium]|nr:hypothetical protein [Myxococcales bacterium]